MKKTFRLLSFLLLAAVGLTLTACSDDDDDQPLPIADLPAQATNFIETYYPLQTITSAYSDDDGYDVTLSDGTNIDFNLSGQWTDVDAPFGQTVPSGFYPEAIDNYIQETYPGDGINEIEQNINGYEVETVNGVDIYFNSNGIIIPY